MKIKRTYPTALRCCKWLCLFQVLWFPFCSSQTSALFVLNHSCGVYRHQEGNLYQLRMKIPGLLHNSFKALGVRYNNSTWLEQDKMLIFPSIHTLTGVHEDGLKMEKVWSAGPVYMYEVLFAVMFKAWIAILDLTAAAGALEILEKATSSVLTLKEVMYHVFSGQNKDCRHFVEEKECIFEELVRKGVAFVLLDPPCGTRTIVESRWRITTNSALRSVGRWLNCAVTHWILASRIERAVAICSTDHGSRGSAKKVDGLEVDDDSEV